jgi:hypothetical protein
MFKFFRGAKRREGTSLQTAFILTTLPGANLSLYHPPPRMNSPKPHRHDVSALDAEITQRGLRNYWSMFENDMYHGQRNSKESARDIARMSQWKLFGKIGRHS